MRVLLALALLAPIAFAQDPPAAAPAKPEPPQLRAPDPLPGAPLPEGAEWRTTGSGLRYVVLVEGDTSAERPGPTDGVEVYYAGFLESGAKFDARAKPQEPSRFGLNQVIKGWTEGLQLMHPGARYKLHIPWQLAYGEHGRPPAIPAKANLIFDVELVKVTPDPTPRFAMPAPEELQTTASGLQYAIIKPGRDDGRKPVKTDRVTVNYAGWLPDGQLCDSSYVHKGSVSFSLNQVIKGWAEGLQLMKEGAVYKFVIPPELGYGAAGSGSIIPPNATLVFQIELVKVGA
jgi:peptidylprolyl isomerase